VAVSQFFPGAEVDHIREHLQGFARQFGIEGMQVSGHVPNTRRALAVTELARDQGRLHPFREAAMDAFWREGRDIESNETLADLARAVGLDPDEAVRAADSREMLDRIDQLREQAHARGVHAIPAFYFEGLPMPVVGCQPYERLALVAERVGAVRRSADSR
jgi:predicted DsbA family dithiol-disulfide isomerase